jgi:hypothetical protein
MAKVNHVEIVEIVNKKNSGDSLRLNMFVIPRLFLLSVTTPKRFVYKNIHTQTDRHIGKSNHCFRGQSIIFYYSFVWRKRKKENHKESIDAE